MLDYKQPKVRPMIPIAPLTPTSKCPHNSENYPPAPYYCVVCSKAWFDKPMTRTRSN